MNLRHDSRINLKRDAQTTSAWKRDSVHRTAPLARARADVFCPALGGDIRGKHPARSQILNIFLSKALHRFGRVKTHGSSVAIMAIPAARRWRSCGSVTPEQIAERVFDAMKERGLTLFDMEARTGLTRSDLSRWLNGRRGIRLEQLHRVVGAVGLVLELRSSPDVKAKGLKPPSRTPGANRPAVRRPRKRKAS